MTSELGPTIWELHCYKPTNSWFSTNVTKRAVARCAGALALIAWFFFIALYLYWSHTRPRKIDFPLGRIYSLNNHGSIAYLTRSEHGFLYSLAFVAGVFFVVAAVIHDATQPGNPRKP